MKDSHSEIEEIKRRLDDVDCKFGCMSLAAWLVIIPISLWTFSRIAIHVDRLDKNAGLKTIKQEVDEAMPDWIPETTKE